MKEFGFSFNTVVKEIETEFASDRTGITVISNLGAAVGKGNYTSWRIKGFAAERIRERLSEQFLQSNRPVKKPRTIVFLRDLRRTVAK